MAKKAKKVPFDPKVFLASVDGGRTITSYRKDEVIFSQGGPADAVFYIQKGKVKICHFRAREGSRCCGFRSRRILPRGMLDGAAVASRHGCGNDRMRDHAAREGNYGPRPP